MMLCVKTISVYISINNELIIHYKSIRINNVLKIYYSIKKLLTYHFDLNIIKMSF